MRGYSFLSLARNALTHYRKWPQAWRSPDPKPSYDVDFSLAKTDDSFLLVGDAGAADIRSVAEAAFTVALDVSHAWTRLAVAGVNAAALLAKGCAVDFHPSAFPSDACAATGLAQMRVVIWRSGNEPHFDLMIGRSFARSLWDWLLEAAREYDCTPTYDTHA